MVGWCSDVSSGVWFGCRGYSGWPVCVRVRALVRAGTAAIRKFVVVFGQAVYPSTFTAPPAWDFASVSRLNEDLVISLAYVMAVRADSGWRYPLPHLPAPAALVGFLRVPLMRRARVRRSVGPPSARGGKCSTPAFKRCQMVS